MTIRQTPHSHWVQDDQLTVVGQDRVVEMTGGALADMRDLDWAMHRVQPVAPGSGFAYAIDLDDVRVVVERRVERESLAAANAVLAVVAESMARRDGGGAVRHLQDLRRLAGSFVEAPPHKPRPARHYRELIQAAHPNPIS